MYDYRGVELRFYPLLYTMRGTVIFILFFPTLFFGQSFFQKTYDFNETDDQGLEIIADKGDLLLVGHGYDTSYKGTIKLVKVNQNGDILFKKNLSSKYGTIGANNSVRLGDTIITGGWTWLKHDSTFVMHASLYLIGLNGDSINLITYGDSVYNYHFTHVAVTPDSGVVAVGYNNSVQQDLSKELIVKYDRNMTVEWSRIIAPAGSRVAGANRVTVHGHRIYVGAYVENISRLPLERFYTNIKKYSLDGTLLANKNYDTQDGDGGAFVYSNGGSLYLTTYLDSSNSNPNPQLYSYMAKLDTNLNIIWKTIIKKSKAMVNFEPIEQVDGNIIATGLYTVRDFATYDRTQGYLAKYDSLGNLLWERVYTGPQRLGISSFETSYITDTAIYAFGSCYAGSTQSNISLDMWLVKTDTNGCISPTTCTDISLEEDKAQEKSQLLIYPQPAGKLLKVRLALSEEVKVQRVTFTSAEGKEIFRQEFFEDRLNSFEVDVEDWPEGIYFMSVTVQEGQVICGKVLVE